MDVLVALNVALGLMFVYLIFALAVTSFNEGIAAVLSSRADWLRRGIASLLTPVATVAPAAPANAASSNADSFYKSPFIAYLGQGGFFKGSKPSYIPAWTIVQGMLSTVSTHKIDVFDALEEVKKAIDGLPSGSPIRTALVDLMRQADNDAAKFRSLVDEWFKTFETQVTAWYRQKTQYVVLGLSIFVVAVLNVDTIAIVRQLSNDPQTREAMAKEAVALAKQDSPDKLIDTAARDKAKKAFDDAKQKLDEAKKQLSSAEQEKDPAKRGDLKAKAEAVTQADSTAAKAETDWLEEQRKLEQATVGRIKQLSTAGIKLGWSEADPTLKDWYGWLVKLVGLLVSVLAVSLGAPFWFDTLKNVAAIRSVGLNIAEREAKKPTK